MAVKEAREDMATWRETQSVLESEVVIGCLWEMADKEGTMENVETVVEQRCLIVVAVAGVAVMGLYLVTMGLVETAAREAGELLVAIRTVAAGLEVEVVMDYWWGILEKGEIEEGAERVVV